ncbi:MAG: hypothetical protein ABL963_14870 [Longimicrobiales bacterium]
MRLPLGKPWNAVLPWALASLPFLLMVAWFWNRGPGLNADDWGLSLLHAQALVEGRPYWDTGYLPSGLDLAPARQPPGLPVLVALTMALAGEFNLTAVKVAMVLAAFPFFLLAGLTFGRSHGTPTGVAVMLMLTVGLAAAPPAAATHVQSDLGFATLVWMVLALLDRPGAISWPRVAAVFCLSTFAVSYRYLGVALAPTIALYALAHRARGGFRLAAVPAVWGLAGVVATFIVGWSTVRQQVAFDVGDLMMQVQQLIPYYGRAAVVALLYPLPWDRANDLYHLLALGLTAVGLVLWTRAGGWRSAAWLFTAAYCFTLLIVYNRAGRYLIPVLPVVLFGFVHGTAWVLGRVRAWSAERATSAAVGAVGAIAVAALVLLVTTEPRQGGNLSEQPGAQEFFAFLTSEHAVSPARVAFVKPRVLTWSTRVPAMIVPINAPDEFMGELDRQGITHVALDRVGIEDWRTESAWRMIDTYGCRFESAFDNGSFVVYRVLPPCTDLARS